MTVQMRRALLSVWDKSGLAELATGLVERDIELVTTGGTAKYLAQHGLPYVEVADLTGAPEILGGRVKTLHPAIHAGLLARLDQQAELEAAGHQRIDLVVINLYPFEAALAEGKTGAALLEMIDIGGPTMLRAAAKNHAAVAAVCETSDYPRLLAEISKSGGCSDATRAELAQKVFTRTAAYDAAISAALGEGQTLQLGGQRVATLRYGENPHQQAAIYAPTSPTPGLGTTQLRQLSGKALSYNNYLDLDAALRIAQSLPQPGCAVLKHTNPCGAAVGGDLKEAFERADAGDPMSAFGGIIAANVPVDSAAAEAMSGEGHFFEIILAPSFSAEALEILQTRPRWGKNVRLMYAGEKLDCFGEAAAAPAVLGLIGGGLLLQDVDPGSGLAADAQSVTQHPLTDALRADLDLAWRLSGQVKSNAIVLVKDRQLVGLGAGQPSRVDSVELAIRKAGERAQGAVLASDGFFPFADGVEFAAKAGICAVIQPGGSRRDDEVIAAAAAAGMPMVMTGQRHFRH